MQKTITKVAIVGGTHGNEITGVHLVTTYQNNPHLVYRHSFETLCLHANPKAIRQKTRYVDTDLNRCFTCKDLNDPNLQHHEAILAKELNRFLGPKGSEKPKVDFIVDLHTTTSNMGMSLCISTKDALTWQVAAYLQAHLPSLNIFYWEAPSYEPSFISTVAHGGFTVEVGPIAQNLLQATTYQQTDTIVQKILDFFELYNTQQLAQRFTEVTVYAYVDKIDFPRDATGTITAMIHPDLQTSGYQKLSQGDPLFLTYEGKTIAYTKKTSLYTVFVNEAAYYEKGVAMQLCTKKTLKI